MERSTFERALHMWPEWGPSITRSRKLLGYDPKWKKDKCSSWIEEHYSRIKRQGEAELERLELPSNLLRYWEDCFYSDYRLDDGSIDFNRITRRLSDRKSLPALPCNYGLVWHDGEDIHGPWLPIRIQVHRRFQTREVFNHAAKMGFETLQSYMSFPDHKVGPHPVTQYINKAKLKSPAWKQRLMETWNKTGNIDDTLHQLYFDEEIQSELENRVAAMSLGFAQSRAEVRFRKRFRDRVYHSLKRADVTPDSPRTKWWARNR